MVNEYRNSINLSKIEVSLNDLKVTDGSFKFSIDDFKEIENEIEEGWRFPTKDEFKYIHSIWENLEVLDLSRNSDYWIYGESIIHPFNPLWELYPAVLMNGSNLDFVMTIKEENSKMRIRLVRDLKTEK